MTFDDDIKPGPGGPKLKKVCVSLPDEHHEALIEAARKGGVPIAAVVRRLIRDVLMGG